MKGSEVQGGKNNSLEVGVPPAGRQQVRCYGVAHVGAKRNPNYPENEPRQEMYLLFELLEHTAVFQEGQEPLPYGRNIRMNHIGGEKSTFAKIIPEWCGTVYSHDWYNDFDTRNLVGMYGEANVVHVAGKGKHVGKTFAEITSIMPLRPKDEKLPPVNKDFYYAVVQHGIQSEEWLCLPYWLRKQVFQGNYLAYEQYQAAGISPWDKDKKYPVVRDVNIISWAAWEQRKMNGEGPIIIDVKQEPQSPEQPVATSAPDLDEQADIDFAVENDDDLPF